MTSRLSVNLIPKVPETSPPRMSANPRIQSNCSSPIGPSPWRLNMSQEIRTEALKLNIDFARISNLKTRYKSMAYDDFRVAE